MFESKPYFHRTTCLVALYAITLFVKSTGFAQSTPNEITFDRCFVIGKIGESKREALHTDAVEALLVSGAWTIPQEGQSIKTPDGSESKWTVIQPNSEGWFDNEAFRGGYGSIQFHSEMETIMLLDASGHNLVYVNGVPRTGDRYSAGITLIPVQINKGTNELLFYCSRGRFKAKLVSPSASAMLNSRDTTLPDLLVGENINTWGAIVVVNATNQPMKNLSLWITGGCMKSTLTPIPDLLPLGTRKTAFQLLGDAFVKEGDTQIQIQLIQKTENSIAALDTTTYKLRIRRPDQSYKRTFISDIDGSVQYFGVQPAHPVSGTREKPALFLSLHGAGVEAIGQAESYNNKTWGTVVAPTNRRPYGFDWEDWGRMDALEVLKLAQKQFDTDPQRTYLTGHSMGGHGTWQLGANFPDRFAAIAPSAGWCSFWSYADATEAENPTPMDAMLKRAVAVSDTLSLSRNYLHEGIYVLHGDADDNVPVSEARTMRKHLQEFHHDIDGYEQPGAGHWWDRSDETGADCLDWPPIFDLFARRRIPGDSEIRTIDFTTANPGVSARCHWLTVLAQSHHLQPATACIRFDPGKSRFTGTTHNISRLSLDVKSLNPSFPIHVLLDGESIQMDSPSTTSGEIFLERNDNQWFAIVPPPLSQKGPHRYGPFKDAFRHRMIFVYGTKGDANENAWALAKARLDAEEFWYRGNGSIQVVPDTEYNPDAIFDHNIILYGNADTNAVWNTMLGNNPIQVHKNSITIGDRSFFGTDLCCLFIQPLPGCDINCVAAIGGTGLTGMRLTDRIPYFVSGVGYPDCIVMSPEVLQKKSEGIRAAGFFGLDWSVKNGEFAWKE